MNTIYRQGDVLIRRVNEIPAAATKVTADSRIVLAHGEVTGHAHAIAASEADEFSMTDAAAITRRFLRVVSEAHITHEEHATVALPAGLYEILQQSEYDPDEVRQVAD